MGSPPEEEGRLAFESQHTRRIGRTFAVAAMPVTVRQFRQFLQDTKLQDWFEEGGQTAPLMRKYSPVENGPIILVDWYRAAAYCNWLSQQDGLPREQWCYQTNATKLFQDQVKVLSSLLGPHQPLARAANASQLISLLDQRPQVTALNEDYLSLQGYRLPTEAEMEYACRAGAVTSRYYGETEELLAYYGWYQKNSQERACPVGRQKPNDLGFFDMQGNVYNWCQESFQGDYAISQGSKVLEDKEDNLQILPTAARMFRGGSFANRAVDVRSAYRPRTGPGNRDVHISVRPARTFAP
jgi:formylglycine-generating enzyme required for sulfatase activity